MADFTMYRGDTKIIDGHVVDSEAANYNLTGCDIWLTAKGSKSDLDASAIFQLTIGAGITVTSAAGGLFRAEIAPILTSSLSGARSLVYDIQVKDSSDRVFTIDTGTISVLEDVTRTTV